MPGKNRAGKVFGGRLHKIFSLCGVSSRAHLYYNGYVVLPAGSFVGAGSYKGRGGRMASKVRLTVCGSSYVVATEEPEEYMLDLAKRLDDDMNEIMAAAPSASVATAAVVAALGYLDEMQKASRGADNMRTQIRAYLEDAAKAQQAAEEASREVERLRREVRYLKEQAGK